MDINIKVKDIEIIDDIMKKFYGKYYNGDSDKTETLWDHTDKVHKAADVLIELFGDRFSINRDLIHLAIKFHDIGKVEKSWLGNKKIKEPLAIRHEVLSFFVMNEYFKNGMVEGDFSDYDKLLVLMAIISHHNKYILIKDKIKDYENEVKNNLKMSTLLKNTNTNIKWPEYISDKYKDKLPFFKIFDRISRINEKKDKNDYIYTEIRNIIIKLSDKITKEESYSIQLHSIILNAADQLGSVNYSNDEIKSFFNVSFKMGQKNKTLTSRDYQQFVIDNFDDDILFIDFRPGAGKTFISEKIAKKFNKTILHGTPKNIISDDLANKYTDKELEVEYANFDLDDMSFEDIRNRLRWFEKKSSILYTTPDNIFLMNQGFKRPLMFLKVLYNGIIVLDEFHDCYVDKYRRFNLFQMVDKFIYFGIKLIFMSGTTPSKFVNKVFDICKSKEKNCFYVSDKNGILSYKRNNEDLVITDIKIENNPRGKIHYFSGKRNDTEIINGLPEWIDKKFKIGYLEEVKKLIDGYVAKGEDVAVCFGSKKGIYHFIHFLNIYSSYKFKEDYAVVCSPSMTSKSYEVIINEAIRERQKNFTGKKKYKFILCTSYTEMGIDFSVQRLIIETTFLHNLDQQMGRLNRWGLYGDNASCIIFPLFTRYDDGDIHYRTYRYIDDVIYNKIDSYYSKFGERIFDYSWYSQEDLDSHYDYFLGNDISDDWSYIKTCGLFRINRQNDSTDKNINGMYRKVDNITYDWKGVEYSIPYYKLIPNTNELKCSPHPDLFT